MSTIAIITARGGSKRIPRKNIRLFCGKPIISYSISAARAACCFDDVMVSTDDQEIAEIARRFGATVPFMRTPKTADDYATTAEVLMEVLGRYSELGQQFQTGCCIYPAAPFVTADALAAGQRLLQTNPGPDSVVPVVRFGYPIQRALKIENGRLAMIWPENINARSQDLMPAYHDAGQFYWFRVEPFLKHRQILGPSTAPIIVPDWSVQDIDTEDDWALAEQKFEMLRQPSTSALEKSPDR